MPTYEDLRARIGALARPATSSEREVHWVDESRVVGVSRTREDRLEIFIVGPRVKPLAPPVAEALEHGPWFHKDAKVPAFEANRLLLPSIGHFDEVAAFVCIELLGNGVETDIQIAFRKTEPIIRLVIERLWISDSALLGLAGELILLNALCQKARDEDVALVVQAWDGWRRSFRDFTWGGVGVEVKTTRGATSRHHVQGTHQVEIYDFENAGLHETGLMLVSLGLRDVETHANSFTVPMLVDRILKRLNDVARDDVAEVFVAHVREYGSESGFGYDHRTMSLDASFTRAYETVFVRAYDMSDKNVSVLRRVDIVNRNHVDVSSVTFTVDLPARVSGDLNPVVGVNQAAAAILGSVAP